MTVHEAFEAARRTIGSRIDFSLSGARETREGWFFPRDSPADGQLRAGGCGGVIVNKASGRCFLLGSAFPVERDLLAYDEGFQFASCDLTITRIHDWNRAFASIKRLQISIVVPEFEHGVEWRIPRAMTDLEIRVLTKALPWTIRGFSLYFMVEVLQEARREGIFEFAIAPTADA